MPKLGLGTWPLSGAECRRAVESALALGYRHIDTAEMYGNEADIGAALAASGLPRDALFVTTKVWHDHLSPLAPSAPPAKPRSSGSASMPPTSTWSTGRASTWTSTRCSAPWRGCRRTGSRARSASATSRPACCGGRSLPARRSPACRWSTTSTCPRNACSPRRDPPESRWSPTRRPPRARGKATRCCGRIARKHGRTPTQVALAWLLEQDAVAAIPKASSEAHQRANLEAASLRLDDEDRAGDRRASEEPAPGESRLRGRLD